MFDCLFLGRFIQDVSYCNCELSQYSMFLISNDSRLYVQVICIVMVKPSARTEATRRIARVKLWIVIHKLSLNAARARAFLWRTYATRIAIALVGRTRATSIVVWTNAQRITVDARRFASICLSVTDVTAMQDTDSLITARAMVRKKFLHFRHLICHMQLNINA